MKHNLVLAIILITVAGSTGCKKEDHPASVPPSGEKQWNVSTIAGSGDGIFRDGNATLAGFKVPLDVAVADDGTIYVADALNHRIRKIGSSQVSTLAGAGIEDTVSGNGGAAGFALPSRLALDAAGNIYTIDIHDPRVRMVSPAGFVTVKAGSGISGFKDGNAGVAQFGKEGFGIAVDAVGHVYVSDYENKRIRKIDVDGAVSTVAGNGTTGFVDGVGQSAQFFSPNGIVVDHQGNLFVADSNRVRKITPDGTVSTFAGQNQSGFQDGQGTSASFVYIADMVIDDQGNIYLSDDERIRKLTPSGVVSTIAGSVGGFQDGDGTEAKFHGPQGLGIDKQGNIYVADGQNNRVRKISFK